MKIKYIFPIALMTLSACMKVKKKEEAESAAKVEVQSTEAHAVSVLSEDKLSVQYIPTEEPNNYTARISWPQANGSLRFILPDGQVFTSESNEIEIPNQSFQKKINLTVDQVDQNSQKLIAHFSLSLQAPQDWVVASAVYFQQNEEVNVERIFFLQGAQIYTQQFNVKIRAKKLISAQGTLIANFPEGSTAAIETAGLSGGTIDLKVEEARGSLDFLLNGQRGGQGKNGWKESTSEFAGAEKCAPNSGANSGNSGSLIYDVQFQDQFMSTKKMVLVSGGVQGTLLESIMYIGPKPENKARRENCANNPVDGQAGKPGKICVKNYQLNKFDCE